MVTHTGGKNRPTKCSVLRQVAKSRHRGQVVPVPKTAFAVIVTLIVRERSQEHRAGVSCPDGSASSWRARHEARAMMGGLQKASCQERGNTLHVCFAMLQISISRAAIL